MSKKRFPLGVRLLLGVISLLLCVLFFVSTFVTILLADFRVLTSKDGLQKLIMQIVFPTVSAPANPIHTPGSITVNGSGMVLAEPEGNANSAIAGAPSDLVIEALFEMFSDALGDEVPVSVEQVKELVHESSIPEFFSEQIADAVSSAIAGEEITSIIATEELVNLVTENKELIETTFEVEITEEQIDQVEQWVEENEVVVAADNEIKKLLGFAPTQETPDTDGEDTEKPNTDGEDTENPPISTGTAQTADGFAILSQLLATGDFSALTVPQIFAIIRAITSNTVLMGLIGLCLAITGLLFVTKWGRPWAALRSSGGVYIAVGGLYLIPTALTIFVPDLFASMGIVGTSIQALLSVASIVPILVFAFGVILAFAGIVLRILLKKRFERKAALAE